VIDHIFGTLERKAPGLAVVEARGVGFSVQIPWSTYDALPEAGSAVKLHTHLHLREDGLALYGFATPAERETFLLLMGVSGVGPRLALSLLSQLSVERLHRAIANEDVVLLATAPGIGKKTAQRIAFELRGKLPAEAQAVGAEPQVPADGPVFTDATEALAALGYTRNEARAALRAVLFRGAEAASAEALVKEALREL